MSTGDPHGGTAGPAPGATGRPTMSAGSTTDPPGTAGEPPPWLGRLSEIAPFLARLFLAGGFLSAVADRLGLWGPPGADGVAWGGFEPFLAYTATLNPWFPEGWIPAVGVLVTAAEVLLAVGLLLGWRTRIMGASAGFLLLAFAVGMTAGTGLKSALDASVLAAAAAGFLLLRTGGGPLSVDGVSER